MFNIWLDLCYILGNLLVTRVATCNELSAWILGAFRNPNFSIWLLDFTSLLYECVHDTHLNLGLKYITVQAQYVNYLCPCQNTIWFNFAEWPGLSALPLPLIISAESFLLMASNISCWWLFQTDRTAGWRYWVWCRWNVMYAAFKHCKKWKISPGEKPWLLHLQSCNVHYRTSQSWSLLSMQGFLKWKETLRILT